MSTIVQQLQDAADKATQASSQASTWANGPEFTTVPTESGDVPTIAEFTRAAQARADAAIDGLGWVLAGDFTAGCTVTDRHQYVLDTDGSGYRWAGALPKVVAPGSIPTPIAADAWILVEDVALRDELSAPGGAGLVGGLAKPVTWSGFAGGADPSGATSSDAAFTAASAYIGDVRVDGSFLLSNPVNRTSSVMEFAPGSTVTQNRMDGGDTSIGSGIPSKTTFGRLVIRDRDMPSPSGTDSFATHPDHGQLLRLDATQVMGQCGVFIGGDKKAPVIGSGAYVGLHTRHDQSLGTPEVWGFNPVVVKNLTLAASADNLTIGTEISVSNNVAEVGSPQQAGALEGLYISYIHTTNNASAAMTTGGLSAGFNNGLWLDGVKPTGVHIALRDEVSANAGARRGLDTSGTSAFTEGAILFGRGHSVNSINTSSAIATLLYMNASNEVVHGHASAIAAHRFIGPLSVFDHGIRPGADNVYDYGSASFRGRTAYFGTGTINTSDERNKPIIERITDVLLDAWGEVDWGNQFKFDDAIEEKGEDGARWHFGLIAQWVRDVLASHGIDGFKLGLLCYDKWDDQYEECQVNEGETVIKTKTVTIPKKISKTVIEQKLVRDQTGRMILSNVEVVREEPVLAQEYIFNEDGSPVLKADGTRAFLFTQVTEEVVLEYDAPAEPVYAQRLVVAAGERYGIRYEEALSLEAALQRRERKRDREAFEAFKLDIYARLTSLGDKV